MKMIKNETQLYVSLARRGDPSAFYALFCEHIRNLYALLRSRGLDHNAACEGASKRVRALYRRFIRRPPANPDRWFAAKCGLRRFDAGASGVAVSLAEAERYEKFINAEVHRFYNERLERGSDGRGDFRSPHPLLPYIAGLAVTAVLAAVLFFSQAVFSVSFGRFGQDYTVSFPKIAKDLWDISGLIRDSGDDRGPDDINAPARPAAAEAHGGDE